MKFRLLNEQNIFFRKIASHLQSTIKKKNQRIEKFNPPPIISPPYHYNGAKNCVKVSSIHRLAIDALDDVHPLVDQWPPVATRTPSLLSFYFVPSVNHFRGRVPRIEDRLGIIYHRKRPPPFPFTYPPSSTNVMKFGKFSIIGESNLTTGTVEIRDIQGRGWNDVSGDESCG